ncbi:uncharacterized protein FFC1_14981 [Fusarium fujikuroi]|nr:uncharacterized protein FFC1_14981 [Fusarium fujikuroi]
MPYIILDIKRGIDIILIKLK